MTDNRPPHRDDESESSSDDAQDADAGLSPGHERPGPDGEVEVVELDLGDDDEGGLSSEEERKRLLAQLAGAGGPGNEEPEPDDAELSSADDRARMLAEVVADAEAREIFQRVATRKPGVTVRKTLATLVLVVAAVVVWVWQPPFLASPAPPTRTPEQVEAALRFAVTLQAERLLERRAANRRLPDLLREAGDTLPGLTYERPDGGSFILEGRSDDVTVRYSSRSDLADFLGDAPLVLAEGS